MPASIHSRMHGQDWLLLLLLSLIWGRSFFFNKVALRGLPFLTVMTLRMSLVAIALWIVVFARGIHPIRSLQVWGAHLVAAGDPGHGNVSLRHRQALSL